MHAISALVSTVCYAMVVLIFVRVAFSWISRDFSNPIYRFCFELTEPLLRPVRTLLPGGGMGGGLCGGPGDGPGRGLAGLGGVAVVLAFHLRKPDGEGRTLARLALDDDVVIHHLTKAAADRQTKPGAAEIPRC